MAEDRYDVVIIGGGHNGLTCGACLAKAGLKVVVVSNASAKALHLNMIDARHLPDELLRDIRNMRTFSTAFKINVACDRPPRYPGLQKAVDAGAGRLHVSR